jgi:hypothetical protein
VSNISLIGSLAYLEDILCVLALLVFLLKRQWTDYSWLMCFLFVRLGSDLFMDFVHNERGRLFSGWAAYKMYFYTYWISFAVESILILMVVYGVFKLAMAPLKGLQTLGMLIFKWAAGISVAVAFGSALSPNLTGNKYLMTAVSQLQRTQSILTLCLLMFIFFAIRPMGLSHRSRIFGIGVGLSVLSAYDLVQSAWLMFNPKMGSEYNTIGGFVICSVLVTWTIYFALPEPKRRMIVLPTTSPFLRWNQISQALGDDPGFVAVGGIPPEMFASAELEMIRRASLKMPNSVAEFPLSSLPEERLNASRAI